MTPSRNIVLVVTDDHGQWCTGAYGNREVRTPTLDHLADTGVRMDNAFCPSPVCSPARASLFSGRRPSQHGIHDWIRIESDRDGSRWLEDEVLLPELVGDAGYATGHVGKWHCGHGRDAESFDVVHTMHHDGWDVDKFSLARDRRITENAISFLRGRADDAPFFLSVGYTATHLPWGGGPDRLVDNYRGSEFDDVPEEPTYRYGRTDVIEPDESEALSQYYAAVQGIDEQVGRLLDELEALGVADETLVVYTADHGHNCGHHGFWGKGNGTRPQNFVEESIRVPLLVSDHPDIRGGRIRSEFVDHCDLFETLVDFAGADRPDDRSYPGRSFVPQLSRSDGRGWTQRQYCEYGDARALRTERYKLIRRYFDAPDLLFDLRTDPREETNVYGAPEYAPVVERLENRLDEIVTAEPQTDGTRTSALPPYNDGSEPWNRTR